MKHTLMLTAAAALAFAPAAQARKMSSMEFMDPKSLGIWSGLTDAEKAESVADFMQMDGEGGAYSDAEKKEIQGKTKACIDKEVADPEYKGVDMPLMVIAGWCMTKYVAIIEAKKSKQ